jgi:hypothetical protein
MELKFQTLDRPTRCQSLYRLSYPGWKEANPEEFFTKRKHDTYTDTTDTASGSFLSASVIFISNRAAVN